MRRIVGVTDGGAKNRGQELTLTLALDDGRVEEHRMQDTLTGKFLQVMQKAFTTAALMRKSSGLAPADDPRLAITARSTHASWNGEAWLTLSLRDKSGMVVDATIPPDQIKPLLLTLFRALTSAPTLTSIK